MKEYLAMRKPVKGRDHDYDKLSLLEGKSMKKDQPKGPAPLFAEIAQINSVYL
jgi:hypothetical protein